MGHFTADELLMTLDVGGPPLDPHGGLDSGFFAKPGFREQYFPGYLQDVRDKPVGDGCSCSTLLEQAIDGHEKVDNSINGRLYQPYKAVHTVKLHDVIERTIVGVNDHPYHQHVYPFQLTSGFCDPDLQHGCGVKDIGHDKDAMRWMSPKVGIFKMVIGMTISAPNFKSRSKSNTIPRKFWAR